MNCFCQSEKMLQSKVFMLVFYLKLKVMHVHFFCGHFILLCVKISLPDAHGYLGVNKLGSVIKNFPVCSEVCWQKNRLHKIMKITRIMAPITKITFGKNLEFPVNYCLE